MRVNGQRSEVKGQRSKIGSRATVKCQVSKVRVRVSVRVRDRVTGVSPT